MSICLLSMNKKAQLVQEKEEFLYVYLTSEAIILVR